MNGFDGIYPALVTPYTSDGKINEKQLLNLVDKLLKEKVTGFYITGSTGECFLLSHEERKQVVEIVSSRTKGKAKLIVHIGSISTQEAIDLGQHAKFCGADAVSAIPPFYYKFSFDEIKDHYNMIMDNVSLPMFVYNFPALVGFSFTTDNIKELSQNPMFKGVKHTSLDMYQLESFKRACDEITVFNGHDEVFLSGLAMGANGAIGSTFNIMATRFKTIMELFKQNKIDEARQEQLKANIIIDALIYSGVNQGIKYLLETMGIECNGCRMPMKKITDDAKKRLDNIKNLL